MLRSVCERTGWALGQAWVRTPDGRALECSPAWHAAAPGLEAFRRVTEALSFLPGIGLPGKAWELPRPVWVRDVKSDPGFERGLFAQDAGLAAGIAVPVLARDEVVAVMEFFMWEEREEDERLVALVSAVAAQLGTLFQQKQAEEALRASEEHFRAVADSAADAILSLDPRGNIAYANAAASRIFGHAARGAAPAAPVTDVLPGGVPAGDIDGPDRLVEVAGLRARRRAAAVEFPLEAAFSRWSAGGRDLHDRGAARHHRAQARRGGRARGRGALPRRVRAGADRDGAGQHRERSRRLLPAGQPRAVRHHRLLARGAGRRRVRERSSTPPTRTPPTRATCRGCWPARCPSFEVEKRLRRADGETIVAMVAVSLVPDAAASARST